MEDVSKANLEKPLLIRNEETSQLTVNFDPEVHVCAYAMCYRKFTTYYVYSKQFWIFWSTVCMYNNVMLCFVACCPASWSEIPPAEELSRAAHSWECSHCICSAWNLSQIHTKFGCHCLTLQQVNQCSCLQLSCMFLVCMNICSQYTCTCQARSQTHWKGVHICGPVDIRYTT